LSREDLIHQLVAETRASQVTTDALDQAVADHMGLNRTDARAIDVIDQRGRLTAGELATAMHLTSGAITSVVDRLERGGWAKRVHDPDDRRRVVIEPTAKVRKLGEELYGTYQDALETLPDYTVEQLELLLDYVRRGRAWTEQRIAHVQALQPVKGRKQLRGHGRA
jgi:DNA-binding MarR family transcriptional regulator